jgi:hypothetical protein
VVINQASLATSRMQNQVFLSLFSFYFFSFFLSFFLSLSLFLLFLYSLPFALFFIFSLSLSLCLKKNEKIIFFPFLPTFRPLSPLVTGKGCIVETRVTNQMGSIDPYKLLAFVVNDELFDVRWLCYLGIFAW